MLPHILNDYAGSPDAPQALHENRMFRVLYDGRFHYIEFLRHKSSSIIIPQFSNGDVLLVHLPRAPIFGHSLEFPRGRVELDENNQEAAARELQEETGFALDCGLFQRLGYVGPDTATLNERNAVFLVNIPDDVQPGDFDRKEISDVFRVSMSFFRDMVREGRIVDAQTLAAYALLQCF
jgi:ADP-ribose pyrophosphatase